MVDTRAEVLTIHLAAAYISPEARARASRSGFAGGFEEPHSISAAITMLTNLQVVLPRRLPGGQDMSYDLLSFRQTSSWEAVIGVLGGVGAGRFALTFLAMLRDWKATRESNLASARATGARAAVIESACNVIARNLDEDRTTPAEVASMLGLTQPNRARSAHAESSFLEAMINLPLREMSVDVND